jgi:hypothetical protein
MGVSRAVASEINTKKNTADTEPENKAILNAQNPLVNDSCGRRVLDNNQHLKHTVQ